MRILILVVPLVINLLAAATIEERGPLPPQPRDNPIPPQPDRTQLSEAERLRNQLEQRMRDLETRIADILHQYNGKAPAVDTRFQIDLEEERIERNEAWRELQASLQQEMTAIPHRPEDELDRPAEKVNDSAYRALRAGNKLSMAECYQQLVGDDMTVTEPIHLGEQVLAEIAIDDLLVEDRPRFLYLRVWFAAELARRVGGSEGLAHRQRALGHFADLKGQFPHSVLKDAADERLQSLSFDVTTGAKK